MRKHLLTLTLALLQLTHQPLLAQQGDNSKNLIILVKDAHTEQPVAGATAQLYNGTQKNADATGKIIFTDLVADTGTIYLSHISYTGQTVSFNISQNNFIIASLVKKSNTLDEVVVSTGFQTLPKDRATGSFAMLDKTKLNLQTGSNTLKRLEGLANGMFFDHNGQRPAITVRGLSSINSSKDPLIIVDNFPYEGDLNGINPNDINDITILKDAAAASIWGARAGNGVIVINTTKGRSASKPIISYNANVTYTQKPDIFKSVNYMTPGEFISVEQALFDSGFYNNDIENTYNYPVISPVVSLLQKEKLGLISSEEAERQINEISSHDVRDDIKRYWYKPSQSQQYSISVKGGTDKTTYLLSGGYDRLNDQLAATTNRYTISARNSFFVTKNLTINTTIRYWSVQNNAGRSPIQTIRPADTKALYPYARLANDTGNPLPIVKTYSRDFVDTAGDGLLQNWLYAPLEDYKYIHNKSTADNITTNAQLQYKIWKGLTASVLYQYEKQQGTNQLLYGEKSFYARDIVNLYTVIDKSTGSVIYNVPKGGIMDKGHQGLNAYNVRGQLSYNENIYKGELNAVAGWEARQSNNRNNSNRVYGYNEALQIVNGVTDTKNQYPLYYGGMSSLGNTASFSETMYRYISWFANASYLLSQKYLFSSSLRYDRSNLFGVNTNQKGRPFWSGGIGWKISKENFYSSNWLPVLNLRSTYGISGNVDNTMSALTAISYSDPQFQTGYPQAVVNKYANPDLRWEKTAMLNIGLDFASQNNIVSGSVEYYQKKGSDLLGDSPVDPTTGIMLPAIRKNIAQMKGKGLDIQLASKNITQKNFSWESSLILNYNRNEVERYYQSSNLASFYVGGAGSLITPIEGRPVYSLLSYKWGGLDEKNGNPLGFDREGNLSDRYDLLTGSDILVNDLVFSGSAVPQVFGSLLNSIRYKAFTLNVNLLYKAGYYFRKSSINYGSLFAGWVQHADFANRWQKPGDEKNTNVPSMIYPNPSSLRDAFYTNSTILTEKADNLRLQFVNLTYNFSDQANQFPLLKGMQLVLNISDIGMIWKANKSGLDPDYPDQITPPLSFTLGIRTGFTN